MPSFNNSASFNSYGLIANALSGAGASVADAITKHKETKAEAQAQDATNSFLRETLPTELQFKHAEELAKYPGASLSAKKAINAGLMGSYTMARQQEMDKAKAEQDAVDLAYKKAQMGLMGANTRRAEAENAGMQALPQFMADTADGRPENVAYAMAQNPDAVNAPNIDNVLRAWGFMNTQGEAGMKRDFMPVPFDVGGRKGLVNPLTGQMIPDVDPNERGKLTPRDKILAQSKRMTDLSRIAGALNSSPEERLAALAEISKLAAEQRAMFGDEAPEAPAGANAGAEVETLESQAKAAMKSNPGAEKAIRARYKQMTGKDL